MKKFETKLKDSDIILKVTYNEDTLSFYNDELLMEQFTVKELLEHKINRLVSGQIFPACKKHIKSITLLLILCTMNTKRYMRSSQ